jgi:hypothetical protein
VRELTINRVITLTYITLTSNKIIITKVTLKTKDRDKATSKIIPYIKYN